MNAVMKYFFTVPTVNWKRFLALVNKELNDFRKVDQALALQEQSKNELMRRTPFSW